MRSPVRILIADDHPIFREGLAKTIARDSTLQLAGRAGDGAEALRLITEIRPDISVLDVSMPVMDGLEVARRILAQGLPTEIVFLTMYNDARYFNTALDLGVRGYLLKDSVYGELLACLKAVAAGQYYISPSLSNLLVERRQKALQLSDSVPALERLTPAERTILRLVAENQTSREIAVALCISERTVENHRMHIVNKLGLHGPHKLLQFALEHKSSLSRPTFPSDPASQKPR